jgi:hypothetical protein
MPYASSLKDGVDVHALPIQPQKLADRLQGLAAALALTPLS